MGPVRRLCSGSLAGFPPLSREKCIGGERTFADFRAEYQCNMLYLGHKPAVKQMLNPMENLRVLVGMHRQISETDILAALAKVGLKGFEDVPCHSLSAGNKDVWHWPGYTFRMNPLDS